MTKFMTAMLAGVAVSLALSGAALAEGKTIGVSWSNFQEERWKTDEKAIREQLWKSGASYVSADAGGSPEKQLADMPGPALRTLTLAELKAYDVGRLDPAAPYAKSWTHQQALDGERIPALTELFDLVRASGKPVRLNVETKLSPDAPDETLAPGAFARAVVEAIRGAGFASRTTVQSFDWRTLIEVKRLAPEIATACYADRGDATFVDMEDGGRRVTLLGSGSFMTNEHLRPICHVSADQIKVCFRNLRRPDRKCRGCHGRKPSQLPRISHHGCNRTRSANRTHRGGHLVEFASTRLRL